MINRRYGWLRDLPDFRDHQFLAVRALMASPRPSSVDLSPQCPPVYDQGALGSCTANAIAGALEFDRLRQGLADFTPSRLFIYYNERAMEGTVPYDNGAQIRDGIKSVDQYGDCPESEWPYDPSQFAVTPPAQCYSDALKYKAVKYAAIAQNLDDMKACLASGFPFVFGFTVHRSFESAEVAQTGVANLPGWFDPTLGGHAVLCVGYDDAAKRFKCRNSWGPDWGDKGYFTMPYDYLSNPKLSSDFWVINLVAA